MASVLLGNRLTSALLSQSTPAAVPSNRANGRYRDERTFNDVTYRDRVLTKHCPFDQKHAWASSASIDETTILHPPQMSFRERATEKRSLGIKYTMCPLCDCRSFVKL